MLFSNDLPFLNVSFLRKWDPIHQADVVPASNELLRGEIHRLYLKSEHGSEVFSVHKQIYSEQM